MLTDLKFKIEMELTLAKTSLNTWKNALKDNPTDLTKNWLEGRIEQTIQHIKALEEIQEVSNCCNATLIPETDVCSDCKEHSEPTYTSQDLEDLPFENQVQIINGGLE